MEDVDYIVFHRNVMFRWFQILEIKNDVMNCRYDHSIIFFEITILISLCLAFAPRFMPYSTFHFSSLVKHMSRNLVLEKENRKWFQSISYTCGLGQVINPKLSVVIPNGFVPKSKSCSGPTTLRKNFQMISVSSHHKWNRFSYHYQKL